MTFTVVLLREVDGRYSVVVPALSGCATWGASLPEALRMAQDAISLHVESLEAHGDPIPQDVEGPFELELGSATEAVVYRLQVSGALAHA